MQSPHREPPPHLLPPGPAANMQSSKKQEFGNMRNTSTAKWLASLIRFIHASIISQWKSFWSAVASRSHWPAVQHICAALDVTQSENDLLNHAGRGKKKAKLHSRIFQARSWHKTVQILIFEEALALQIYLAYMTLPRVANTGRNQKLRQQVGTIRRESLCTTRAAASLQHLHPHCRIMRAR